MTKLSTGTALATCAVASAMAFGGAAWAQDYPNRPVEMVVTFGPGGGADLMGRTMAQLLEEPLGVSIPVSNVAGASGNAGLTRLRTNPADGYTIGTLISLTVASWASGLGDNAPEDFRVISVVQSSPSFLFVPTNGQFKTAEELFAYAKENPVTVATSGYGTQDDVTLKLLSNAGIPMENVPFQAPAERYASPIGKPHRRRSTRNPATWRRSSPPSQLRACGGVRRRSATRPFKDTPTSKPSWASRSRASAELSAPSPSAAKHAGRQGGDNSPGCRQRLRSSTPEEWKTFCERDLHLRLAQLRRPAEAAQTIREGRSKRSDGGTT